MSEKRNIPVVILGQEYRIRSDADDQSVRRAAAMVDETMARVRDRTGTVDTQSIAVLAALNIANNLLALRGRGEPGAGPGADSEQLGPLIELVEGALRDETPVSH